MWLPISWHSRFQDGNRFPAQLDETGWNAMQTDYRHASSGFRDRAEVIAEQLILWGVIATLIFLAVTMIRAA